MRLGRAFLHLDVCDAKRKGIRRHASVKLQGKDEAKLSAFVCLAEGWGVG